MNSIAAAVPPATALSPASRRTERLLVAGTFITSLGNGIQLIAAAIVTLAAGQSMVAVGWVFVAFSAPPVLLSLVFGRVADRFDRRRVCITCDLLSAAVAAALPTWLLLGGAPSAGIYAATLGLSALSAMFLPANNALIKERVADRRVASFNAHFEMALQAGTLLSSAIGGVLVQLYGAEPLFYFNAVTFLASAALFLVLGPRPVDTPAGVPAATVEVDPDAEAAPPRRAPLARLGLLYGLGNPVITVSNTVLVVLVIQTFRQGAGVLGVVDAIAGVGFLLAAVAYKLVNRRVPNLWLALAGYFACAAFVVLQPRFGITGLMILLPLGTLTFGIARISCRTMLMRAVPEQRAGRVFGATNAFGLAFSVVATMAIAGISDHTAVRHGFTSLAVLMAGTAGVTIALLWRHRPDLASTTERTEP
jgi:MFS family permease